MTPDLESTLAPVGLDSQRDDQWDYSDAPARPRHLKKFIYGEHWNAYRLIGKDEPCNVGPNGQPCGMCAEYDAPADECARYDLSEQQRLGEEFDPWLRKNSY